MFSGWVAISRTQLHAEVTSRLLNKPVWSYIEKYLTWSSSIKTRMVAAAMRRRMLVAYAIPTAPPLPSCCWISQKLTTTSTIPCSTPLLHGGTESSYRKKIFISHRVDQKSSLLLTAIFHPVARHSGTPKLVALRVSGVIKHLELQVSLWLRLDMWHGC